MENIYDELRINICIILNSVTEEIVNYAIQAIKCAALESLSDLKFVQEADLMLVLKPIQRRKLIKAWNEQNIPTVKLSSNAPLLDCRWKRKRCLKLLQTYTKYKVAFLCSGVEKQKVWRKIADEIQEDCSLNCDALQCSNKIKELESEYEKIKNRHMTDQQTAEFLDEAKKAFETTENLETTDSITKSLKKSIRHTLNSVSEEILNDVIYAVQSAGLESLLDLQFVQEDDLPQMLKPIQRRKLIKVWSQQVANIPKNKYSGVSYSGRRRRESRTVTTCAKVSSNASSPKFKWLRKRRLALLRLYAAYETELSSSDTKKVQKAWNKIADEIGKNCSIKCDATECRNQIYCMKCEYEKTKHSKSSITCQRVAIFLDEAENVFDNFEKPVSFSTQSKENLKKWVMGPLDRVTLLKVYAKYKTELLSSDVEEQNVWRKIAREVTEKCSSFYGERRCCFEIKRLKSRYESFLKKGDENVKTPYFFNEAKNAFGSTE